MLSNLNNIAKAYCNGNNELSAIYISGNKPIWCESDYYTQYFTTESEVDNNTITLTVGNYVTSNHMTSISYSYDKVNWTTTTIDNTTQIISVTLDEGDRAYWKGIGNALGGGYQNANYWSIFSATGNYKVYGNIASLLFGDDFIGKYTMPAGYTNGRNYQRMWYNDTHLTDTQNLVIPFYNFTNNCFANTFQGCTSLLHGPELYFTSCGDYSCQNMFNGCTAMTTCTKYIYMTNCSSVDCMNYMFNGCSSLVSTPIMKNKQTTTRCFQCMFYNCTSLENNYIELNATPTPSSYAYDRMFSNTKIKNVQCLATGFNGTDTFYNWLYGVPSGGTFIKAAGVTWPSGDSGIPSGWTVVEV